MLAIAKTDYEIHDDRAQRLDAVVPRGLDHPATGTDLRVVGESVEWRGVLRDATQVSNSTRLDREVDLRAAKRIGEVTHRATKRGLV